MSPEILGETLSATATNWKMAVKGADRVTRAGDLYVGRSITEARQASDTVGAPIKFVSAGLGMVSADDRIPSYDLTPAEINGGLAKALEKFGASPADWWSELSGKGLSGLIRKHPHHQFLIALPATYLSMLRDDLERCREEELLRLRFFTSPAGVLEMPRRLRANALPYDERLETVELFGGTRGDFPQRAMRHFVQVLHGHKVTLDKGRRLVEKALASQCWREIPVRARLADDQIKSLIRVRWKQCGGQSALLLRALRDQELVACEQGRFAQLWRETRDEIGGRLRVKGSA